MQLRVRAKPEIFPTKEIALNKNLRAGNAHCLVKVRCIFKLCRCKGRPFRQDAAFDHFGHIKGVCISGLFLRDITVLVIVIQEGAIAIHMHAVLGHARGIGRSVRRGIVQPSCCECDDMASP